MAWDTNRQEGDVLTAQDWNQAVQEIKSKQPRLNVVDGLDSTSSVDVLSAKQGKVLNDRITDVNTAVENVSDKIDKLPTGIYYGQYDSEEDLEDVQVTTKGYAYISSTDPAVYYIYLYNGNSWTDSGNKFVTTNLETDLSTKSQTKAPTTKVVAEGIEAIDVTTEQEFTSTQKETARTNINAQEDIVSMVDKLPVVAALNNRTADVAPVTNEVRALGYKVLNSALDFAEQVENVVDNDVVVTDNSNTIFEIRDEFDLEGYTVTIPANCTLKFNGGKLKNGTLVGNNTLIEAPAVKIFNQGIYKYRGWSGSTSSDYGNAVNSPEDLTISGTWRNESVCVEWFDITNNPQIDASKRIINLLKLYKDGLEASLPCGDYYIFRAIELSRPFNGNGSTFYQVNPNYLYDETIAIPNGKTAVDMSIIKSGVRAVYQLIYANNNSIRVRNFNIDGQNCTAEQVGFARSGGQSIGTIGLIGCRATQKVLFENISVLNAAGNGFLGMSSGSITLDRCTFYGSGEHEFYARPTTSETSVTIKNCRFDQWGNDEATAILRGNGCKAIKCQGNQGGSLIIEDTYIGTSPYNTSSMDIVTNITNINNCIIKTYLAVRAFDLYSTVNINNTDFAGFWYTDFTPIVSIYNSKCGYSTLSIANTVINCNFTNYTSASAIWRTIPNEYLISPIETTIMPPSSSYEVGTIVKYTGDTTETYTKNHYYVYKNVEGTLSWVDETTDITNKITAQNKRWSLTVINCLFVQNVNPSANNYIKNCSNLKFISCKFVYTTTNSKSINLYKRDASSTVWFYQCIHICSYNTAPPFTSDYNNNYLIGNTIIEGNRSSEYSAFNKFLTLATGTTCYIYNNESLPYNSTAALANIVGADVGATNITINRITPTITSDSKISNTGTMMWNTTLKKPTWYNGEVWVDANGDPTRLSATDTTVLIGATNTSANTITVYSSTTPQFIIQNVDGTTSDLWLTESHTNSGNSYTVTLTANADNPSTTPRGCKVVITNSTDVIIVNVIQSGASNS